MSAMELKANGSASCKIQNLSRAGVNPAPTNSLHLTVGEGFTPSPLNPIGYQIRYSFAFLQEAGLIALSQSSCPESSSFDEAALVAAAFVFLKHKGHKEPQRSHKASHS